MTRVVKQRRQAAKSVSAAPLVPAGVMTLQQYPLLQIPDEDPASMDVLEVLLRPDSVRIATRCCYEEVLRTSTVNVSPADFEALVERGRAHGFTPPAPEVKVSDSWTFQEDPLLQIWDVNLDPHTYLEVVLRLDGVTFASSACDHAGVFRAQSVRITPASFQALIQRGRTHRFGG